MRHFNALPLTTGVKLIYKCIYLRERAMAWDMWVSCYPKMTKDNYIPFNKFFSADEEDLIPKQPKSIEDLLAEASNIDQKIVSGQYKEIKV